MSNNENYQYHLALAKEYYVDAPESIWEDSDVISIIRNKKLGVREALMGKTINGYLFRYRGLHCIIM